MAMTLGKDVSQLFPDVLKNIATGDLDQKKLVYLYLMWALPLFIFEVSMNVLLLRVLTASIGTMPNHTPIYVFSPSTHSSKTPKTPTPSFERLLSELWAVLG